MIKPNQQSFYYFSKFTVFSYFMIIAAVLLFLIFTGSVASAQAVTADAGPDRTVAMGVTVRLDASASFDPQGETLSYIWGRISGPTVSFPNNIAMPTFTAPSGLTADVELVFELTVFPPTGNEFSTDRVTITVLAAPVPEISASVSTLTATAGRPITPVTIDASAGGGVDDYEIRPAIGNGLAFDTATGTISGTPVAPASEVRYTITARNSVNTDMVDVAITVIDIVPDITARVPTLIVPAGRPITPVTIDASAGGRVVGYAISPAIGNGLAFDTATGTIFGTPVASASEVRYTITARNSVNTDMVDVAITVIDIVPDITARVPTLIVPAGRAINPVTIDASAGGGGIRYTISPAIGNGLAFDTATGTIFGTPVAPASEVRYTITARNSVGTDMVDVAITVTDVLTADAGPDRTVAMGVTVRLDASASFDPQGETLSYIWGRISGPTVSFPNNIAMPTFTAPSGLTADVELVFELTVFPPTGNEFSTDRVTITVLADSPPLGLPRISGTATEGETLSADTSGISDADGPDTLSFSYQWQADGTDISGATEATFTLTQAQVGALITVVVSYTDGQGTSESLTSVATAAVTNVNDVPVGLPVTSGTATEGETLSADTSGISDADGPDTLNFSYQWQAAGNDISGGTDETFTLTQAQVGDSITVVVSYIDAQGTSETLTSVATAAVTNVNDVPVGLPVTSGTATEGETLSADTSGISDADGPDTLSFSYQWQAAGNDISGGTDETFTLTQAQVGALITVVVSYTDGQGTSETLTSVATAAVTNVNDVPVGLPVTSGTATEGETLSADTSGISDADGPDTLSFSYQWQADGTDISGATEATFTLTQAQVGALITVVVSYTDGQGTSETLTSVATSAVTNVNDVPVGLPVTSGTATEGETLSADTSGISDADGPDTLSFSYQWQAAGNDISGATDETFTLTQAQVGDSITVVVSYIDAQGTSETLTSVATAAVTNVNDVPVGLPVTSGTATEGETLSADTSGISDADGPDTLSFSYQWQAAGTDISGGTDETFTLTQAQVGALITVVVSYTDGQGTSETLTSVATAAVTNVNDVPVGLPVTSGTATEGETLSADTSGISDADGPDTLSFSYQWQAAGNDISGATDARFALTQAQVGESITVVVTYTDAANNDHSLTSVATAPVTADATAAPTVLLEEEAEADDRPGVAPATTDSTGKTITLPTSEEVNVDNAETEDFTVTSTLNDKRINHEVTNVRTGSIILDVSPTIQPGASITVSYNPGGGSSSEAITDLAGNNKLGSFNHLSVRNVVTTAPAVEERVKKTIATINRFLHTRTTLILANQPKLSRRINRLQRGVGTEQLSFATGEITKLKPFEFNFLSLGSGNYKFATSLDQVTRAADHLQVMQGDLGGLATIHERRRFDVWFEASFNKFNGTEGSGGEFGIAYLGADYLVSPDLLFGALVQYDQLSDSNASQNYTIEGKGWMAGPYVTARLRDNLYLDARLAWGTSDNEISPQGTNTDSFKSTRWLTDISLSGEFTKGQWTIRPNASLSYMADRQKAYINTQDDIIPGQTVSSGQLRFGPNISPPNSSGRTAGSMNPRSRWMRSTAMWEPVGPQSPT